MKPTEVVYSLVAMRDLRASLRAYLAARESLPTAEGVELLALHEATVDSLDALLTELGEHGLEPDLIPLDLDAWVAACAASWREVERLRASGLSSAALIDPWVGQWMDPIGSRDWLKRMRLSVSHHQEPQWLASMAARLAPGR